MAANVHHLRWLLPTPGRLLAVLLGVEGFLWLSERFQWFPFNHHKGWTVLIAVAAVGVFLLLMLLWFLLALVLRLRFQFSVRSLLMLPLLVVLPGSWLAAERREAEQQRDAIAGIRASAVAWSMTTSGLAAPGPRRRQARRGRGGSSGLTSLPTWPASPGRGSPRQCPRARGTNLRPSLMNGWARSENCRA